MVFAKYKTQIYQAGIFSITASLYMTLHASRTAWAYAKPTLAAEHDYSDTALSMLDFSFLCAYAIGLFLNGWLGDRLRLKLLLCQGMLLTVFALVNFSMLGGLLDISSLLLGVPLFALLGLGQSTAFPGCIAILTNWFHSSHRGLVFGVWMTNINLGNILGQQLGKEYIDLQNIHWPYLILTCGGLVFVVTCVCIKFLHIYPSEVGLAIEQEPTRTRPSSLNDLEENVPSSVSTAEELPKLKPRAIGFWEAWKQPGVLLYAIIYVCTKSTTSAIMFWLPTYLKLDIGFKEDTASLLAFMEIGSLVGVITLGYIVDKFCNKAIGIFSSLFGAMVIFFALCFIKSPDQYNSFAVLLFLAGLLLGGPAGLIVGALSSDLGERKGKGSENCEEVKATSTITGIIDGSGTVGAAVIQPIIPFIRSQFFVLYTVLLLIATILTPFAHKQASGKTEKGMAATDQINQESNNAKELQI